MIALMPAPNSAGNEPKNLFASFTESNVARWAPKFAPNRRKPFVSTILA